MTAEELELCRKLYNEKMDKIKNKFIRLSLSSGVEQARVKILHLYL